MVKYFLGLLFFILIFFTFFNPIRYFLFLCLLYLVIYILYVIIKKGPCTHSSYYVIDSKSYTQFGWEVGTSEITTETCRCKDCGKTFNKSSEHFIGF